MGGWLSALLVYLYEEEEDLQEKIFQVSKEVRRSRVVQDFEFLSNSNLSRNFFLKRVQKLGYSYLSYQIRVSFHPKPYPLTRIRIPSVSARILCVSYPGPYQTRDTLVMLRIRASQLARVCFLQSFEMGPVRGMKRRKKTEKKVDQNVLAAAASLSSQPQPIDWWDDFSQRITGPLSQSKSKDRMKFESVFKVSRKTFSYICSLVKEEMMTSSSNFSYSNGKQLSLNDQVAVALRRLSSGESLVSIGDSFGINRSTVSHITWRFVEAMEERGLHHLCWPTKHGEMEEIKSKFEKIRGLPNCCGAIDITHILMTHPTPGSPDDVWLDCEEKCSMILQAIVDPDMRFRNIITGWPGSLSDELVLRSSGFFKLCEERSCLNGKKLVFSEGTEVREYIVGDSGFPLLQWLLTPYKGRELSNHQCEFNKRLSATQMVARRALVRLKEMWRIIQGVMWTPDKNKLPRIILVCCILHNIVIDLEDEVQDELPLSHHHDSGYRQQTCESADNTASLLREKLALYLSGEKNLASALAS